MTKKVYSTPTKELPEESIIAPEVTPVVPPQESIKEDADAIIAKRKKLEAEEQARWERERIERKMDAEKTARVEAEKTFGKKNLKKNIILNGTVYPAGSPVPPEASSAEIEDWTNRGII